MDQIRQGIRHRWGWLVWLLIACFTFVACEGPYVGNQDPPLPAVRALPTAQPVYQAGMPGVLQEALHIVKGIHQAAKLGKVSALDLAPLEELKRRSLKLHKTNIAYYTDTAIDMKQRGIPTEMIERLKTQEKQYIESYQHFQGKLNKVLLADVRTPAQWPIIELEGYLRQRQPLEHQSRLDPNNLPHQRMAPVKRTPMTSTQEYAQRFGLTEQPEGMPIAAPTAGDLKETTEVKLTPEIKALAAKLKSPLEIYKWVRNNIKFHPTYGSIQGADYCRQNKLCNAFDTASLLIALLRAQKIPARYVFGTADIPVEQARNWVSRFDATKGPVGRALASGGVPAVDMIVGGKVSFIRMEHVWVEAWVDYIPSRGRFHKEGDTWIPMDPSFKQNTYKKATDLAPSIKYDAKGNYDQFKKNVTKDSLDGVTKGPDMKVVEAAIKQSKTNIDKSFPTKDVTYEKMAGSKTIQPFQAGFLPAALPYPIKTVGQRLDEVPDRLRHKVRIAISTNVPPPSPWGYGFGGGSNDFNKTMSLPEVLGKQLSLAYNPATTTDETTLTKYWPKAADQTKSGSWPKSLPTVVRLKPVLLLDGKVVVTGKATKFGSDNKLKIYFTGPGINKLIDNTIVAGTYQAIVINPVKISGEHVSKLKQQSEALAKKINKKGQSSLGREAVYGNHLHSAGLNYWSQQDINNAVQANRLDVLDIRLPSCGLFAYELDVTYAGFGPFQSPRSIKGGRVSTDIDHDLHAIVSHKDNQKEEVRYFSSTGIAASAYEASTWETSLRPKTASSSRGISSVHMLQYASQTGVPIYSIRKSNLNSILPKLSLPRAVINDIRSAAAAGKSIVTAAREMVKDGWKGVGYIITDDATGAGAYLISGGKSGGGNPLPSIPAWLAVPLGIVMVALGAKAALLGGIVLAIVGIALAAYDLAATFSQINSNPNLTDAQKDGLKTIALMMAMIGAVLAIAGIWFGAVGIFIAMALYFLYINFMVAAIINGMTNVYELQNRNNPYL